MEERLAKFRGLSKEEEVKLLALSDEQRKMLAENDRKLKNEFLQQAPAITHGGVKMHEKYKHYVKMAHEATRWSTLHIWYKNPKTIELIKPLNHI